jgi:hypothetical protein
MHGRQVLGMVSQRVAKILSGSVCCIDDGKLFGETICSGNFVFYQIPETQNKIKHRFLLNVFVSFSFLF